jgi:hypothetical protein
MDRFINKDYRSREEGCIDKMLKELNLTTHIYTTEKKDV